MGYSLEGEKAPDVSEIKENKIDSSVMDFYQWVEVILLRCSNLIPLKTFLYSFMEFVSERELVWLVNSFLEQISLLFPDLLQLAAERTCNLFTQWFQLNPNYEWKPSKHKQVSRAHRELLIDTKRLVDNFPSLKSILPLLDTIESDLNNHRIFVPPEGKLEMQNVFSCLDIDPQEMANYLINLTLPSYQSITSYELFRNRRTSNAAPNVTDHIFIFNQTRQRILTSLACPISPDHRAVVKVYWMRVLELLRNNEFFEANSSEIILAAFHSSPIYRQRFTQEICSNLFPEEEKRFQKSTDLLSRDSSHRNLRLIDYSYPVGQMVPYLGMYLS